MVMAFSTLLPPFFFALIPPFALRGGGEEKGLEKILCLNSMQNCAGGGDLRPPSGQIHLRSAKEKNIFPFPLPIKFPDIPAGAP